MDFYNDTWYILDEYFKTNYFLTKHHLDSFNDFVLNKLKNTIRVLNPFVIIKNQDNGEVTHEINVYIGGTNGDDIYLSKPTIVENGEQRMMYPNEARLKDLTYKADIFADVEIQYKTQVKGKKLALDTQMFPKVKIGAFPIMLHSCLCALNGQPSPVLHEMGECIYDQGGYFVIDGKEKVIVAQERIATNKIFINKSKDPKFSVEGLIRCTSEENPLFPKTVNIYVHADRSKKIPKKTDEEKEDDEQGAEETIIKHPNSIVISVPNIKTPIPLFVLFRILGVESDKSIMEHILQGSVDDPKNKEMVDFLRYSVMHGSSMMSQQSANAYLSNFVEYQNVDKLKQILIDDVFPNVGKEYKKKALFLGHIINKLVRVCLGASKESDRDSYIFKRVDISGFLVANLFRDYYRQFRVRVRNTIDHIYLYGPWRNMENVKGLVNNANLSNIFKPSIIEDGMKKSLKGSWGVNMIEEQQDADDIKQGVVQDLSRLSYIGFLSHLRRVNTPIDPTSKMVAPHRLHTSQWGIMCPCESPDGASIGLLKNFAIMCKVTFDTNPGHIVACLKDLGVTFLNNMDVVSMQGSTKVLINSNWVGNHKDPVFLYQTLKLLKRNAFINVYTSVSWNILQNEILILTEAGRCCRPVYVVNKGKLVVEKYLDRIKSKAIAWADLITGSSMKDVDDLRDAYVPFKEIFKGMSMEALLSKLEDNQSCIEYIDVDESNNSLIAMDKGSVTKQTTHCEIHPSTIFSVVTHQIPLTNHNQAPRNIFSGAQGKQAIGCYATNFPNRIDTMSYILHYPQKSLVDTRFCDYLNINHVPNGENLILALASYTGYNMEDAIIINRDAIQRGSFNVTYFKNMVAREEENKRENEIIVFNNPKQVIDDGKALQDLKWANYTKLDENGFPKVNSYISEGDAVIGKTKIKYEMVEDESLQNKLFANKVQKELYLDRSVIADKTLSGIVDKVFVYVDDENMKTCKIRFRKTRMPELGDKCCSRSAQKGCIGMIVPRENMPFTKDGIVPDIIINPHAIPSRMTMSHLLETLLGKIGCLKGMIVDGTPFNNNDYSSLYDMLEKEFHMERYGNEIMYNGLTGDQIASEIYIGPTYYERLKHMVADKINYRQVNMRTIYDKDKEHLLKEAPVNVLTRQPTKGRGNNGGLRIGEMEKDSILSHGMLGFLKESLMERSDKYEFYVDSTNMDILNKDSTSKVDTSKVSAPYAFKQFVHELNTLAIKPELHVLEPIPEDAIDQTFDDAYVDLVHHQMHDEENEE